MHSVLRRKVTISTVLLQSSCLSLETEFKAMFACLMSFPEREESPNVRGMRTAPSLLKYSYIDMITFYMCMELAAYICT